MRVVSVGSFDPQELEQFRAGHEEFAPQHPTRTQFAALDHPIDAEIMDAQKLGGFLDGIGKPLCLCQSWRQRWRYDVSRFIVPRHARGLYSMPFVFLFAFANRLT